MGQMLGSLGQAWLRLLLYPGGLAAFGLAWLLARWMRFVSAGNDQKADRGGQRFPHPPREIAAALLPLLALALLPVPPARSFPYGIDLVTALALLGWARLRRQAADGTLEGAGLRTLLPGYGLLLLGAMAMGTGAGGMELSRLLRAPDTALGWGLLLGGSGLWLIGQGRLYAGARGRAAQLGELGQLWIGAIPILTALTAGMAGRLPAGWAGWALPPLALLIAALALGLARRISP
ncbi:MAG: hypothetical protein WCJ55_10825 [Chloroflexales bacterium]